MERENMSIRPSILPEFLAANVSEFKTGFVYKLCHAFSFVMKIRMKSVGSVKVDGAV